MHFLSLQIDGVRNLSAVTLNPSPGLNWFTGPNGSGKTSLLESLYLLARASSFRTPRIREVIQHRRDSLTVSAQLSTRAGGQARIGVQKGKNGTQIRYNGTQLKTVSEQARNVPLSVVSFDSYALLSGSPRERRRWLDWGVFHVEPSCLEVWRKYHAALQHRNALLRSNSSLEEDFFAWEQALHEQAGRLTEMRAEYLRLLEQNLSGLWERSGVTGGLELQLAPGWDQDQGLSSQLAQARDQDREQGYTRYGPHRAELYFLSRQGGAVKVYSRGQQKMLLLILACAQALVLRQRGLEPPVLLADDLAAELDQAACARALQLLGDMEIQVFITATESASVDDEFRAKTTMFHVKQGKIYPLEAKAGAE